MTRRKIEWIEELLVTQMNHWVVMFGIITIMGLFDQEKPLIFPWILTGIIPFLFCIIRLKVKQFSVFFLLHIASLVVAILLPLPNILYRVILAALVLAYSVVSIRIKLTANAELEDLMSDSLMDMAYGTRESADIHSNAANNGQIPESLMNRKGWDSPIPPVASCGVGVVMLFFLNYIKDVEWSHYYAVIIVVYHAIYFIYYYLHQYLDFLMSNTSSAANIPERAILRTGTKQVVLFALLAVLAMILLSNLKWIEFLGMLFIRVFFFLLRLLIGDNGDGTEDQAVEEVVQNNMDMSTNIAPGEAGFLWEILEKVFYVAAAVAIVVGVVYGMIKVYQYLHGNFRSRFAERDKSIDSHTDIREDIVIETRQKKVKTERKLFAFLDNKEKIRKSFKKKVLQENRQPGNSDYEYLNYRTAEECCKPFAGDTLQKIYEKARYSGEECTSEDAKLAKAALKNS